MNEIQDGLVVMKIPTAFKRDRIVEHYQATIENVLRQIYPDLKKIEFKVAPPQAGA